MADIKIFCLLFICVSAVSALQVCKYYIDEFSGFTHGTYCEESCCGDMDNRYCCNDEMGTNIVGIAIGCVCGVLFIASIGIAIRCYLSRSRGQQGQVCQPVQTQQSGVNINYGNPSAPVVYGVPGYNNAGFIQTTTMTAIPPPYAQSPPKYEELNTTPFQPNWTENGGRV